MIALNIWLKLHIIEEITKGNNCLQVKFWNSIYQLIEISLELWKSLKLLRRNSWKCSRTLTIDCTAKIMVPSWSYQCRPDTITRYDYDTITRVFWNVCRTNFFLNILGPFQNKNKCDWNFFHPILFSPNTFLLEKKLFSGGDRFPRLDFPHVAVKFSVLWTLVRLLIQGI